MLCDRLLKDTSVVALYSRAYDHSGADAGCTHIMYDILLLAYCLSMFFREKGDVLFRQDSQHRPAFGIICSLFVLKKAAV